MMIEEKQNILRSFEGQKIDESVHVARWATINNEDSGRNIFMKYAAGSSSNTIQPISSQIIRNENMYNTQQSQVHQIDTGFKKLKNTQIEMLKQLKQEYQVLRTLNIEQKSINQNKILNSNSSKSSSRLNESHRQNNSQILSSSSHHGKKPQMNTRQAQILAIQKKQLEMVINNSMRKIQELLHSEMEYKKQIHQLKIQVTGRQNTDHQYQAMLKTLKKNQIYTHQTIQSLKKENQKYKLQTRQLNQKISTFQGQLIVKDQQIRRIFDQKRKTQDLVRIQKDRFFNVDLDYKKIKMEYELLQKQKNSQIMRLTKQLEFKDSNKQRQLQGSIKRYQDDIATKDKRYVLILPQIEDLKRKINDQQRQIASLRSNQNDHVLDKQHIADILTNFRDQNDNVSFNRNMNEVLERLQHMNHNHNQQLQEELAALKDEILNLKQITHQGQNANFILYEQKIQQLQNQNNRLADELRRLKKNIEQINNKYSLLRKTTDEQAQQLRNLKSIKTTQQIDHSALTQTTNYKRQIDLLQQQLRVSKRKVDQSEFKASKALTQLQYKLRLQYNEHQSVSTKYGQDLNRAKFDLNTLREQNQRLRNSYEKKLSQKQTELSSLRLSLQSVHQSGSPSQKIKQQLQLILKSERQQYRKSSQQLTQTIAKLSKSNEKYILQSNKYLQYENELNVLKEIMRRSIKLSQGIDHLWRIKETQYQNVDLILETTKAIPDRYY